ncbi:MAG: acyl carrier protein [Patescibacteria group bacterium]
MERLEVAERIIIIVSDQLDVLKENIDESSRMVEDLGADSLDLTELTMKIEEEFDIAVPDEVAATLKTVGQTIDYVLALVKNE